MLLGFLLQKLLHQRGCGTKALSLWHCSSVTEAQVALMAAYSSSVLLGLVSEKRKATSLGKPVGRRKHGALEKLLVDGGVDSRLVKTQWTIITGCGIFTESFLLRFLVAQVVSVS